MIARGLGRSYGDAAQNAGGDVLLCTDLDRVLALDIEKGLVTAEAGVSLDTLLRVLLPLGWCPDGDARHELRDDRRCDRVGHPRQVPPRLASPTTSSGCRSSRPPTASRTLDPDGTPEPFWATAGGMGLTGVDHRRDDPPATGGDLAHHVSTPSARRDVDDCMARMLDSDHEYRYSVAWIDCLATGRHLGRSVLTRGNHATLDELPP